ncbi:LysE/ArgO family amino acid transporter [Helicobacter sp. MIT 14-3879]|uniref:LysE/ArgO family amino acid transporter n=1 Tax=Helicobacter sp. MIT 14-3879 TaxID=2040649 RepID=UPI0021628966|nr:LysE family transporter [Helicobacter sp. MIT 14-3879]
MLNVSLALIGALFVLYYGLVSLKAALFAESSLKLSSQHKPSMQKTLLLTLAVTFLNPHVYLDTVFVVGASALMFNFEEKIIFAFGALTASFLWFFGLGYGALRLSQVLAKITRILDFFIALIMFFVFYSLIEYILRIN